MNRARWLWRSVLYFRATHLGVVAGVAVGGTTAGEADPRAEDHERRWHPAARHAHWVSHEP